MKRVLFIDKCQDCNVENCKIRTMCGLIPDECSLLKSVVLESTIDVNVSKNDGRNITKHSIPLPNNTDMQGTFIDKSNNDSPSWDNAPKWANWLTYDKDGWYWWQDMPDFYDGVCIPEKDSDSPLKADFPIPENTTSAIYSRPQKKAKK